MARSIIGTVVSDVQDRTIVVKLTTRRTHSLYGKQYTESSKFMAHDENNQAKVGDKVEIVETRPFSKHKSWQLSRVVEAGRAKIELKDEVEESA